MNRGVIVLIVCALAAIAFAAGAPEGGQPKDMQKPSPDLGRVRPIPRPEPGVPTAIDVNVLNFPLDEGGHLTTCDHSSAPRRVEVTNPSRPFELVGFTIATTLPNIGVFGMTRLCQAEFTGARFCTLDEALSTVNVPLIQVTLPDRAWVRDSAPLPAGVPRNAGNCGGWRGSDGMSQVLTADGGVAVQSCNDVAHVACCTPAP